MNGYISNLSNTANFNSKVSGTGSGVPKPFFDNRKQDQQTPRVLNRRSNSNHRGSNSSKFLFSKLSDLVINPHGITKRHTSVPKAAAIANNTKMLHMYKNSAGDSAYKTPIRNSIGK